MVSETECANLMKTAQRSMNVSRINGNDSGQCALLIPSNVVPSGYLPKSNVPFTKPPPTVWMIFVLIGLNGIVSASNNMHSRQ